MGKEYILHIEFQVSEDSSMVHRGLEYCAMLMRKYKLPIKQFVVYMKEGEPKMPTSINEEDIKYRYQLIQLSKLDS